MCNGLGMWCRKLGLGVHITSGQLVRRLEPKREDVRSLGTCPDAKLFVEVFFLCRNATPVLRSDLVGERVLVVFTYAKI